MFLKISPMKEVMRFRKKDKLSLRYISPFPLLKRIGVVVYRLDLPPELENIHPVFHVFMLKKYLSDPSHILLEIPIELDSHLRYEE